MSNFEKPESLELAGGGILAELGRGADAVLEAAVRGEDITPHVESLTAYIEARVHEGVDALESVLGWLDKELGTALVGMAAEVREVVTSVFEGVRALSAQGIEVVNAHPEVFRAVAVLIVIAKDGAALEAALPLLRDVAQKVGA